MFFSRNENTNLTMRKIFTFIYYFSFLTLLFFWANTYALWSQYDVICSGLKATLKVKNCINNAQWVSKCQLDEFKKNVCSIWWWYNIGPLYPVQERMLYSDIDTRISVSTEDMKKELLRYMEKNEVVSYAWEQWKDLDFILMIQEESLWEEFIFWDSGTSIGYCQISKIYGKELYEAYLNAKDWKERITLCHDHYLKFANNVGIVFHGWKTRKRNLPSFSFR